MVIPPYPVVIVISAMPVLRKTLPFTTTLLIHIERSNVSIRFNSRSHTSSSDGKIICSFGLMDKQEEDGGKAPPQDRHEGCDLCEDDDDGGGKEHAILSTEQETPLPEGQEDAPLVTKTVVDRSLCSSILLGDGFHNFADGVFIAAAFKSCSTGTAISIVLVTLFHEIAQELADFIVLTRYAGLSICKAMVLNFLSGLSVCLGGVVFLAANPSNQATGIILAMGGGLYFNIAACETVPRLEKVVNSRWDRAWTLLSIIIGTIPIGLILLNHQHCG